MVQRHGNYNDVKISKMDATEVNDLAQMYSDPMQDQKWLNTFALKILQENYLVSVTSSLSLNINKNFFSNFMEKQAIRQVIKEPKGADQFDGEGYSKACLDFFESIEARGEY